MSQIVDPVPRFLVRTDLKANEQPEYVAIWLYDRGAERAIVARCLEWDDEGWSSCGSDEKSSKHSMDALIEELAAADIETITPAFKHLRVGDRVFDLN